MDQKLQDVISQRNSVKRTKELIIKEWKHAKEGKDFPADMGMVGAEVATRETLGKLREALAKVHPSADWSKVEAEYKLSVNAELEVDDALDIESILAEEVSNAGGGEVSGDEDPGEQNDSSTPASFGSEDDEERDEEDEEASDTSSSGSSSSSA